MSEVLGGLIREGTEGSGSDLWIEWKFFKSPMNWGSQTSAAAIFCCFLRSYWIRRKVADA